MTLAERIAELESKLEDYKKSHQEYRRRDGIMPWALQRATERVEADLGWLRELEKLRPVADQLRALQALRTGEVCYDGSTGAEFVAAATEALGGGLTAEQAPGFCLGCGERDCCCPASCPVAKGGRR